MKCNRCAGTGMRTFLSENQNEFNIRCEKCNKDEPLSQPSSPPEPESEVWVPPYIPKRKKWKHRVEWWRYVMFFLMTWAIIWVFYVCGSAASPR